MQEKGLPRDIILGELKSRLGRDLTYESGKILGSMCTKPHPFAREVFTSFVEKNLGDPGLFPATAQLEREAIKMIGSLLSNPHACGRILTGGTEANIIALWTAKKLARGKGCEVIVPVSAHCSFDKAADMLGLRIIKIGLNERFQMNAEEARKVINSRTAAIVGVAGTTGLGVVDPIQELSEIASEKGIYLHVDAAFGGFVLPFLRELGFDAPPFDFQLPGVCSITVDPHKMGMAPIPAGGLLFRSQEFEETIAVKVPYLSGGETEQTTVVGTRSGASVIAVWALLRHLGREGYRRILERCMRLTWKLAEEIRQIEGVNIVTKPTLNIVGLKSERFPVRLIAQRLRLKGWAVSLFSRHIRIVVMPHVREEHIENFLNDLRRTLKELDGRT